MFSTKTAFEGCFDVPRLCVTSSCIFFLIVFFMAWWWDDNEDEDQDDEEDDENDDKDDDNNCNDKNVDFFKSFLRINCYFTGLRNHARRWQPFRVWTLLQVIRWHHMWIFWRQSNQRKFYQSHSGILHCANALFDRQVDNENVSKWRKEFRLSRHHHHW